MRKLLMPVAALAVALMVAGPARPATNDRPEPYSATNPATTVGPQLPRQSARPQQLPQPQPVPVPATADEGGGGFDWGLLGLLGLAGLLGYRRRGDRPAGSGYRSLTGVRLKS